MSKNNWVTYKMLDILEPISLPVDLKSGIDYREIGIRSHGKGIFHKEITDAETIGNKRVFEVIPDALIFNIVFAWEQAVAKTSEKDKGFIASHRFPQYLPKDNLSDIDYLLYLFMSPKGKYLLNLASPGGAGRNKTLGKKAFDDLELKIPTITEQQKIVKILSTWDKAISTTERLIENSTQQQKALMQQLLTGKKRLLDDKGKRFEGKWEEVRLEECANSLDNLRVPINSEQRQKMFGNIPYWGANGVVGYIDGYIFDETIVLLAEDGGYFDEFANRPIANISYGKSWVNNHAHVLTAKDNTINEWLYYSLVHKNILAFINGGTRAKLNKGDMFMIPIFIPSIKEQQKIVTVLTNADKEIELLEQQLADLQQEKKALMQQLLTGKKRMVVDGEVA